MRYIIAVLITCILINIGCQNNKLSQERKYINTNLLDKKVLGFDKLNVIMDESNLTSSSKKYLQLLLLIEGDCDGCWNKLSLENEYIISLKQNIKLVLLINTISVKNALNYKEHFKIFDIVYIDTANVFNYNNKITLSLINCLLIDSNKTIIQAGDLYNESFKRKISNGLR